MCIRDSHCAALDASKAFDKVLHYRLFFKIVSRGIASVFINVLIYWYSRLHCAELWKSFIGEKFMIKCGVRQGGVLSLYLFSLYVDHVIIALRKSAYGIHAGNIFAGCILYAEEKRNVCCSFSPFLLCTVFIVWLSDLGSEFIILP